MDTATQAVLGATIGQVGFAPKLGRRALWWGAVGGLLPDLDVLAVATHGPFGEFLYHRGFTHSLWFGPVVGPALGYAVWRAHRRRGGRDELRAWIWLFVLALFTHPLLDVFTTYGTQLLAPFSTRRFALNGVGIIDGFYTGPLLLALAIGWLRRRDPRRGVRAAALALAVSTAYLFYGLWLNVRAEEDVRRTLVAEGLEPTSVRAYPTIFQPYLRRIVARTPKEVRVGLYTPWRPGRPEWEGFAPPRPHPLVDALRQTREGSIFVWFAMGETVARVIERRDGAIVEIDDLRYGVPGEPDEGMWGIRAFFDRNGVLRSPVYRFDRGTPDASRATFRALFKATFGDFSEFSETRIVR